MSRFVALSGLVFALAAMTVGCSAPEEPGVVAVEPAAGGVFPEPGVMIASPPVPIAFNGTGEPWNRELIADSLFLNFGAGASSAGATTGAGTWVAYPTEAAAGIVPKEDPDTFGRMALEFAQAATAMYVTQTTVPLDLSIPGVWAVATMEAQCAAPGEFGIAIGFDDFGVPVSVGKSHPGDGQWHEVACAVPLLEPHPGARLTLSVIKRGSAAVGASVRRASLRVLRERPADVELPGGTDGLVMNGSFEDYSFTGSMYPWAPNRWGGSEAAATLVSDGSKNLVSAPQPPPNGGVGLTQQLLGLTDADRGATISATASGIAHGQIELIVAIRCMKNGQQWTEFYSNAIHPGDGQWHSFTASLKLPTDDFPDAVYVDVYRKPVTDKQVVFDDIRVVKTPAQ